MILDHQFIEFAVKEPASFRVQMEFELRAHYNVKIIMYLTLLKPYDLYASK